MSIQSEDEQRSKTKLQHLRNDGTPQTDDHFSRHNFTFNNERPTFIEEFEKFRQFKLAVLFRSHEDYFGHPDISQLGGRRENFG
jgi:hypothetical protein